MKKKIALVASAALTLALVLTACGGGKTEPTRSPGSPTDIKPPEATATPAPQPIESLTICGIPVVSNSQPTGIAYKGAEYKDGVLTLTDVNMVADYGVYPAIDVSGNLTIVLAGENTITVSNGQNGITAGVLGDEKATNLTFMGDGSLSIVVEGETGAGIYCTGNIIVSGGSLDVEAAKTALAGFAGTGEQMSFTDGLGIIGEVTDAHVAVGSKAE